MWLDALNQMKRNSGKTLKQISEESKVPLGTLNKLFAGQTSDPKLETIKAVVHSLGHTLDELETQKTAPSIEDEAVRIGRRYAELPESGKGAVKALLDYYEESKPRQAKLIPLLGNSFAAGTPEPDFGNALEDYEVDAGSRAEFAIRVHGDSMEPKLTDGSIALGIRREPKDGDIVALMLDGGFLVKQYYSDSYGNVYLRSLNEKYEDIVLRRSEEHVLLYFGTII